jgi:two-component system sensor histidine kinase UhpB
VRVEPGVEPPMEQVAELLTVAREALTNIARHADAHAAELDLSDDGVAFRLEVIDDGRGFDASAQSAAGHHGIANMRQRAARLGGTLEVASQTGRGTRIILTLPHRPGVHPGDQRMMEPEA